MTEQTLDAVGPRLDAPVRPAPVGWVVMWPKPGGGYSPVYHHGAERPNFGSQLHALLTQFPVYSEPPEVAAERVIRREETCGSCDGSGRMVRDPDIGTDQECFVCDGRGRVSDA